MNKESEFIEAKKLDAFKNEIVSEFLSLCCYNDWCDLPLFRIVETIDEIYDKYYSKPRAEVVPDVTDTNVGGKWIPVTERLPEKTGKYLVYGRGNCYQESKIWICECIGIGKVVGWCNDAHNPIATHWMPLPEPPETEKGGE